MIKGKLVLEGIIEFTSPALIGSGNKELTDIDMLLDADDKPFIPATSFTGVLKNFIYSSGEDKNDLDKFWGFANENNQMQSNIICSDLCCTEGNLPNISSRDGIKIDSKTGVVKQGAKYDYQVVEKGAKFDLYLEAGYKDGKDKTFCLKIFALIKSALEDERIRIGAKTNSGMGKIKLAESKFYEFDFSKKEDVLRWFKKDYSKSIPLFNESIADNTFTINATFRLKNSFIIRDYSDIADSESIKSGEDFVMTGTSLKGAIRNRAERILKTLRKPEDILKKLFGDVDETNKTAIKGKIQVDEVILPKYTSELQPRIKIDRFTGGTIESALFNSMPVFSKGEEIKKVKIAIRDYEDYEAGLMLLILKDLWTGDLAVGGEKNVGRGVFEGIEANISWNDGKAILTKDNLGELSKLQTFVDALIKNEEVENAGS